MIGVCISGGGAKIGFAVGVLEVMGERGVRPDLAYGISSGSICTAALCYGDVPFLKDTLRAIKRREDVLQSQPIKLVWTLLTHKGKADGWYEMNTMRKKLDSLPKDTAQIKGVVGYVQLKSGNMVYKSSQEIKRAEFLDAVQASCSIPAYMQSQRVGDECNVDGGVRDVLPLGAIIGDPLKVDEIHIICLSPLKPEPVKDVVDIKDVAIRSIDLLVNEAFQNDYKSLRRINRMIAQKQNFSGDVQAWLQKKRYVKPFAYVPEFSVCETTDFCTESIDKGIAHGREIAERVLKNYPTPPPESTAFPE